jgi:hypothetical protein
MSAPECGTPTKRDGRPCRRRRYHPCRDHGSGSGRAKFRRLRVRQLGVRRPGGGRPEPTEAESRYYREPRWRGRAQNELRKIFGEADTRKLRELQDCRDLAAAARVLEKAARLDPGPLLEDIEKRCGPEAAHIIRGAASKVFERMTGIDSLKDLAMAFRIAGVWRCVLADALETCPCRKGLERDAGRLVRAGLLDGVDDLIHPPGE